MQYSILTKWQINQWKPSILNFRVNSLRNCLQHYTERCNTYLPRIHFLLWSPLPSPSSCHSSWVSGQTTWENSPKAGLPSLSMVFRPSMPGSETQVWAEPHLIVLFHMERFRNWHVTQLREEEQQKGHLTFWARSFLILQEGAVRSDLQCALGVVLHLLEAWNRDHLLQIPEDHALTHINPKLQLDCFLLG